MNDFRCCMAQIKQYEQEGSTCHVRFSEETRWTTSLQIAAVHGSSEMVEGLIALGVREFNCLCTISATSIAGYENGNKSSFFPHRL